MSTQDEYDPALQAPRSITVRAGVPQIYGHLIAAAHEANIPVLFSANAFAKRDTRPSHIGSFRISPAANFNGFNLSAARKIPAGLDAALDSAGFVASSRYGCYRWTVDQYYDLVTARDWPWPPGRAMDQVQGHWHRPAQPQHRRVLRSPMNAAAKLFVTVDGPSTRDIDDTFALERTHSDGAFSWPSGDLARVMAITKVHPL